MSERSINPKTAKGGRRFDPALFFETAAKGRTIAKHRKSEIIFSQGDEANAVFYIKKGKVKVTVVSKQGKEAVVAILGIDEFVGEGCLIGQPKRLATASAMSECVTMRVDKTGNPTASSGRAYIFPNVCFAYFGEDRPCGRRFGGPAIQFHRETACSIAVAVGQFRQGRSARTADGEDHSGNTCGDDRHNSVAGKPFHE